VEPFAPGREHEHPKTIDAGSNTGASTIIALWLSSFLLSAFVSLTPAMEAGVADHWSLSEVARLADALPGVTDACSSAS